MVTGDSIMTRYGNSCLNAALWEVQSVNISQLMETCDSEPQLHTSHKATFSSSTMCCILYICHIFFIFKLFFWNVISNNSCIGVKEGKKYTEYKCKKKEYCSKILWIISQLITADFFLVSIFSNWPNSGRLTHLHC